MKNRLADWLLSAFIVFCLSTTHTLVYAQNDSKKANAGDYVPDLTVNAVFETVVDTKKPPRIIDTLETVSEKDTITVEKIRFESIVDKDRTNHIFAYLIHPKGQKNLPAVLMLHGGTQTADDYYKLGIRFAQRGYTVLIPDLPGITSPDWAGRKEKGSSGKWADYPYGQNHFLLTPNATASNIYEGVVTAIQAFYLLRSQSFVDTNRIGIRGLSWGGYATIITTALLGKRVKAGFAVYGSGFYDLPSYFKTIVDKLEAPSRHAWLSSLDAGRYADRIQAPFYFMAASNDTYFHPPAVVATYNQLKGEKNILFSPNNDHSLSNTPDPEATEFAFFDYYLRQQGAALPQISLNSTVRGDTSHLIEFAVTGASPVRETRVWYSAAGGDWRKRVWISVVPTAVGNNRFRAVLPAQSSGSVLNWYITATDARQISAGTVIY